MSQFHPKSADLLERAGQTVLELVSEKGMSPDDAIVKVASDMRVPRPFLNHLVHGYNIVAAALQRDEVEDGILGKMADFPIARLEECEERLYPTKVTPPNEEHHKTAVAACYAGAPKKPMPKPQKTITVGKTEKKASAVVEKPIKTAEQAAVKAAQACRSAHSDFEHEVAGLVRYFSRPVTPVAFSTFESAARHKYAEAAVPVLDYIANLLDRGGHRVKRAGEMPDRRPIHAMDETIVMLDQTIAAAERILSEGEKLASANQTIERLKWEAKTPSLLREDSHHLWDGEVLEPEPKLAGLFSGLAGPLSFMAGTSVGQDLAKNTGFKPTGELVNKTVEKLQPVGHQQKLRGVETDFILRDLAANDEVVQHHTPEQIAEAYNELAATAPNAMGQPGTVRAMMRKRLSAGVLDPVDITQLLDLEQRILKNRDFGLRGGSEKE